MSADNGFLIYLIPVAFNLVAAFALIAWVGRDLDEDGNEGENVIGGVVLAASLF